jgi:hypothetical protein
MVLENLRVIFPDEYRLILEMADRHDPGAALSSAPAIFLDNLRGYGIIDDHGQFSMSAMQTYLRRFLHSDRYFERTQVAVEIENSLRHLILYTCRREYKSAAEREIHAKINSHAGDTIATPLTADSAAARLRICRLPTLCRLILADWSLFESMIGSREAVETGLTAFLALHGAPEKNGDKMRMSPVACETALATLHRIVAA